MKTISKEETRPRLALWEEHFKDPIGALDKALMCVENSVKGLGPKCFGKVVRSPMAAVGFFRSLWEEADLGGRLAQLGSDGYCACAQRPWNGTCQGSTGRMARSFSS